MRNVAELRVLPLAAALILLSTAIPAELRSAFWPPIELSPLDFAANILLYAPLGLALWKHRLLLTLATAIAVSSTIEVSQIWSFERFFSPYDIAANTVGAVVGASVARGLARVYSVDLGLLRVKSLAAPALLGLAALAATTPIAPSGVGNWNLDYALLLGNERTGDRPWQGTISMLAILPAALEPDRVRQLSTDESLSALQAEGTYVLGAPVQSAGGDATHVPIESSKRVGGLIVAHGAFSVAARVSSDSLEQTGPARIVSYSTDPFHRNFDVGQDNGRIVFRVRTMATDPNGNDFRAETGEVLAANRATTIVATFDSAVARIYVDGSLQARSNLAAAACFSPVACDTARPLLTGILGAALAAIGLVSVRVRSIRGLWGLALTAGLTGTALLWLATLLHGGGEIRWAGLMPFVGSLAVMVSARGAGDSSFSRRRSHS